MVLESTIRIAHFVYIRTSNNIDHRYQNFFFQQAAIPGTGTPVYNYAPFEVRGTTAAIGGDNPTVQLLFPHTDFSISLVEGGNGNRLSRLQLNTVWMDNSGDPTNYSAYTVSAQYVEYFVGIGASFSDTTIELRFKSAMDSVGAPFPGQQLNSQNVGILPLNSDFMVG
jgi:hypothetical protein